MISNSQIKDSQYQVYIEHPSLKISINFINKKSKNWNLEYKVPYLINICILLCTQWSNLKISIGFINNKKLNLECEKEI